MVKRSSDVSRVKGVVVGETGICRFLWSRLLWIEGSVCMLVRIKGFVVKG